MADQFDDRAILRVISANQRRIRLQRRMTQKALANEAGLDLRQVERIEGGKHNVTVVTLARIAMALQVPPYWLLR